MLHMHSKHRHWLQIYSPMVSWNYIAAYDIMQKSVAIRAIFIIVTMIFSHWYCYMLHHALTLIHMRGPCGPKKTLPGASAAFFGTPEITVHLIVRNTKPLSQTTLFFPSGTVIALKPWHNSALSALGSVRTP